MEKPCPHCGAPISFAGICWLCRQDPKADPMFYKKHKDIKPISIDEAFGANAGAVWNTLRSHGRLPLWKIAELAKMSTSAVSGVLGWLGREGKIRIVQVNGKVFFELTEK